jgi:hypothetical protein
MKWWNVFRRTPPAISKEQALDLAQQFSKERGWYWSEPVDVKLGWRGWRIYTNSHSRGANIIILIHRDTGEILEARFLPR